MRRAFYTPALLGLLCTLAFFSTPAIGAGLLSSSKPIKSEGTTWLTSGFWSYHLQSYYEQEYLDNFNVLQTRKVDFNGNNSGIGLEHRLNPSWSVSLGTYNNSYREQSNYIAVTWSKKVLTGYARLGLGVGAVTGYEDFTGERIMPTFIPSISMDSGKRLGFNLLFLPSPVDVEASALALQLKFRLR